MDTLWDHDTQSPCVTLFLYFGNGFFHTLWTLGAAWAHLCSHLYIIFRCTENILMLWYSRVSNELQSGTAILAWVPSLSSKIPWYPRVSRLLKDESCFQITCSARGFHLPGNLLALRPQCAAFSFGFRHVDELWNLEGLRTLPVKSHPVNIGITFFCDRLPQQWYKVQWKPERHTFACYCSSESLFIFISDI